MKTERDYIIEILEKYQDIAEDFCSWSFKDKKVISDIVFKLSNDQVSELLPLAIKIVDIIYNFNGDIGQTDQLETLFIEVMKVIKMY